MFPYILLISLSSLCSSILNSWNYFSIPAFSPIFLNISIIFFSVFFSSFFCPSIIVLAWSVIIGGLVQLLYQLPFLYKINMLVLPNFHWNNIGLLRILKKMGPAILGASANQISLIINTVFSSLLNSGSISWIYYADRLIEFPVGILGVLRISLIVSLPGSVILFFLAKPVIIVLFQYGKFTDFDVLMTARVLKLYSCGLISFIFVKILSSAFYACEEIKIPMKASLFTLLLNQLMNPFLIFYFQHAGLALSLLFTLLLNQLMNPFLIFYFQHAGLALSLSISSWVNFLLLYRKLYQRKIVSLQRSEFIFIIYIILSTLVMIVILFFWNIGSFFNKIIRLFFVLFVSGITYLFMLNILGIRLLNFSYKNS